MATAKPRITITLEQNHYNVLKSISDSSGQPMSSVINELIQGSMPAFERMAVVFQKISRVKEKQRIKLTKSHEDMQAVFDPMLAEALGQFDMFMGSLEDDVSTASGEATGDLSAPSTNRGVTPSLEEPFQAPYLKASKAKTPSNKILKNKGNKS
jgi:predicted CopG family antitoxin